MMSDLFFIAGPCVIESLDLALSTAETIAGIAERTGTRIIYKSSFDKANRTSGKSFRGLGMEEGLRILERVKYTTGLQVLTDVHEMDQIKPVAEVVDVLQTPALLCRQTDFIRACAATDKPVNIKKGQWASARDMKYVAEKAISAQSYGCRAPIMLCERGSMFGYNDLVVDMRGLAIMGSYATIPVVFDATHSCQMPGGKGSSSDGNRAFVPALARAAVATGVDGVFMETHPDPWNAPCDGPNMLPLSSLESMIVDLLGIDRARRACTT